MRFSPIQRAVHASEGGIFEGNPSWNRVLIGKHPDAGLELLQQTGELRSVLPEVQRVVGFGGGSQGHKDLWAHTKQVVKQSKAKLHIRWAALFHDVGKPESFSRETGKVSFHQHEFASARLFREAMKRTGLLEGEVWDKTHFLIHNLGLLEGYSAEWTDSAVRRLHKELGEHFEDVLLLGRADVTSKHAHKRERVQQLMHDLSERARKIAAKDAIVPPLPKGLGTALMSAFNIPPSKRVGELMKTLEGSVGEEGPLPHQEIPYYVQYVTEHRETFGV